MLLAGISLWYWGGFLLFVLAMLALDLGVLHRKAHEVKMKEALVMSGVWIALALLFNGLVFLAWDHIQPQSAYSAREAGVAWLTGYIVEKSLSVDNIFVFLMVFAYFQVPAMYQHRVLFWGILGALVFRAIFIAAGAALLKSFGWMVLIFGIFLLITGVKMLWMKDKELEPEKNPVIRLFRKIVPVTPEYQGQRFFVHIDGRLWATPLFITLMFVEFTDILFAVDSIPAIFAITQDPFIVFTSNVFAILGLRALFFAVSGLLGLFHFLSYGLSAVLMFIGGKMCWTYAVHTLGGQPEYKFPTGISLGVILGILVLSMLASLLFRQKVQEVEEGEHLHLPLPHTEDDELTEVR
jgi:tellurite resistance protein TerC